MNQIVNIKQFYKDNSGYVFSSFAKVHVFSSFISYFTFHDCYFVFCLSQKQ